MNCKSLTVTVKSAPRAAAAADCVCTTLPVNAMRRERVIEISFLGARVMDETLKQIHTYGFLGKRNYSVITRCKKRSC
jgi:hypothetical protein